MPRLIPLTKGYSALVDDGDYDWLNQWKWSYLAAEHTGYAYRSRPRPHTGPPHIRMHRLIMGVDGDEWRKAEVDHINRDGLDNRRENLRVVDHAENQRNSRVRAALGVRGVRKQYRRWQAYTTVNGRYIHIGMYESMEAATEAVSVYHEDRRRDAQK